MSFNNYWSRPSHLLYPNVWLQFKAKDVDTNDLVDYTVQDLPDDRFAEAINIMATGFLADAPMAKLKDGANDLLYVRDNVRIWEHIVKQRMTNVCFKNGSDEIVGLNFNFVSSKDDAPLLGDNVFIENDDCQSL